MVGYHILYLMGNILVQRFRINNYRNIMVSNYGYIELDIFNYNLYQGYDMSTS